MSSLKNWDNRTWLSSKKYIESFNNFILKHQKLNKDSKILCAMSIGICVVLILMCVKFGGIING